MNNTPHLTINRLFLQLAILVLVLGLAACAHETPMAGSMAGGGAVTQSPAGTTTANSAGNAGEAAQYSDVELNQRGLRGIKMSDRAKFLNPDNPLSTRSIYFSFDSSRIPARFAAALQAHAHYLAQHPQVRLRLEGNTDERGTRDYNVALGERRAESVKKALVLSGASLGQISTLSFGEERPVCRAHNESCWSQNRRVDLIYIPH